MDKNEKEKKEEQIPYISPETLSKLKLSQETIKNWLK